MSDAELAWRIVGQDERALVEVMRRYRGRLEASAYRVLRHAAVAEEVASEVFLRVSRRDEPPTNLARFLFATARNLARKRLRRRVARARRELRWCESELRALATPEQDAEARERQRLIRAAIDALPEQRRRAFELVVEDGLRYKEAADELELAWKTVKNYVAAARKELREKLSGSATGGGGP